MAGTITTISKLEPNIQALCEESLRARLKSYSPYSKFKVGAALQCGDDVISGCNVENASYGLTVCAERTAVVKAVSEGITEMDSVAIAAHVEGDYVGPCGMCRQTLAEYNPGIKIYLVRLDRSVKITNLSYQLPDAFTPKKLALKFYNGESNGEPNGEPNGEVNGEIIVATNGDINEVINGQV